MTPDPLQERVARVLAEHTFGATPATLNRLAAAVLADLREAGELRELEQVGWYDDDPAGDAVFLLDRYDFTDPTWVPVYIVREDTDET